MILLPGSYYFSKRIMDGTLLGIESADMLPIIKVMGNRFYLVIYMPFIRRLLKYGVAFSQFTYRHYG
jgi:hypothetical protein